MKIDGLGKLIAEVRLISNEKSEWVKRKLDQQFLFNSLKTISFVLFDSNGSGTCPIVFDNIVTFWRWTINPEHGDEEDLDNPDNLVTQQTQSQSQTQTHGKGCILLHVNTFNMISTLSYSCFFWILPQSNTKIRGGGVIKDFILYWSRNNDQILAYWILIPIVLPNCFQNKLTHQYNIWTKKLLTFSLKTEEKTTVISIHKLVLSL